MSVSEIRDHPPRISLALMRATALDGQGGIATKDIRLTQDLSTVEETMASKGQLNGMRGTYLAAAELARLGFITSPTSRSAAGADILATTHDCNRSFSVQVKTKTTPDPYFMLGTRAKEIKSKSHFYVLVRIKNKKGQETIEYYVVPSSFVARNAIPANPNWTSGYLLHVDKLQKHKSNWSVFGNPTD